MQTQIDSRFDGNPGVKAAEEILRRCVHCGFCLATCPTYTVLGDELDSPRGRIYQIKQVLEGQRATSTTQQHLDRCLTCRSCETSCPSGVEYGRLIDTGRDIVDQQVSRPLTQKLVRQALKSVLPYKNRLRPLVAAGRITRPLMPAALKKKLPEQQLLSDLPASADTHQRKVLALGGCAQPVLTPATDQALRHILDRLQISLITPVKSGCCGAVTFHLDDQPSAREFMKTNIDAWWPFIEQGAEAIIVSASGCGVMVKDYAHALKDDPTHASKAERVSALACDPVEFLEQLDLAEYLSIPPDLGSVACHTPCTQTHGLKLPGRVETLLASLGYSMVSVDESHICCGSAGTYSILQPAISDQLKQRKLDCLQKSDPSRIVTANIGCQLHLQADASVPVVHWLELVASHLVQN